MSDIYTGEDQILLQKISEGDTGSFNLLYEKYWRLVYSSAIKRLRDHEKAQDTTQDIFTNLWLKRSDLQIDNLPAYLYAAVRNKVLNLFEKEKRYTPLEQLVYDNIEYGEQADAMTLRHEFMQAYKTLVESLPSQRKKIFHYHFDQGLSTEEIADKMALSRKTVQNQLGRAVLSLKAKLSHLLFLLTIL